MSEANLSEFEKIFLLHGVQVNFVFFLIETMLMLKLKINNNQKDEFRLDGRSFNNYRPIGVEFNKINNCYGSCQLTLVILIHKFK
jgi:hypothetical protein